MLTGPFRVPKGRTTELKLLVRLRPVIFIAVLLASGRSRLCGIRDNCCPARGRLSAASPIWCGTACSSSTSWPRCSASPGASGSRWSGDSARSCHRLVPPGRNGVQPAWQQVLRPISPLAWIPIAILWFGVGDLVRHLSDLPRLLFSAAADRHQCRAQHSRPCT